jgi:hypothetical protein
MLGTRESKAGILSKLSQGLVVIFVVRKWWIEDILVCIRMDVDCVGNEVD